MLTPEVSIMRMTLIYDQETKVVEVIMYSSKNNAGEVVEPDDFKVVAEVAQKESDLVRWPADEKATADNQWRHNSVASSFADGCASDRTHLKINHSHSNRSFQSSQRLNKVIKLQLWTELKQEYCSAK